MQFQPDPVPGLTLAEIQEAFLQREDIARLSPEEQAARWAEAEPNIRRFGGWATPKSVPPDALAERLAELE